MTSIACVIPCRDGSEFLESALASVRAQRRTVSELIVVDDGSTDGSIEIATRLGATVLRTSGGEGPSAARNVGWRAATSEFIAFLDADDLWDADHCESLAALLEIHPDAVLAYATVRYIGSTTGLRANPLAPSIPADALVPAAAACFVPQMGVMIRRATLESIGGYDHSLRAAEDFDLFARLAEQGRFVTSGRTTASYRQHAAQTTRVLHRVVARQSMLVRQRNWARLVESQPPAVVSELRSAMRARCSDSLRDAFAGRDREAFHELLQLADTVPGGNTAATSWRWRSALLWWPWSLGSLVWRRLPVRPQRLQRWVERSLLRSSS